MKRVLFLCSGNSCRSQIAQAIVNHYLPGEWLVFSAGTRPTGYIHPLVFQVLQEIGINHTGSSKSLDEFRNQHFDLVITVCDDAKENCPLWLGDGNKQHIGFPDPAVAEGNSEQILMVFRDVRDQIIDKILKNLAA